MGKPEVSVRLAQGADLNVVNLDQYISDEPLLKKIAEEEVFLLTVDGEAAGYLRLEYLWSVVPYIALIRIAETWRGRGYSHHLLEFVEKFLRERGCDVLYSSSTGDEPEPQAWHRQMGLWNAASSQGSMKAVWARFSSGKLSSSPHSLLTFYYKAWQLFHFGQNLVESGQTLGKQVYCYW